MPGAQMLSCLTCSRFRPLPPQGSSRHLLLLDPCATNRAAPLQVGPDPHARPPPGSFPEVPPTQGRLHPLCDRRDPKIPVPATLPCHCLSPVPLAPESLGPSYLRVSLRPVSPRRSVAQSSAPVSQPGSEGLVCSPRWTPRAVYLFLSHPLLHVGRFIRQVIFSFMYSAKTH